MLENLAKVQILTLFVIYPVMGDAAVIRPQALNGRTNEITEVRYQDGNIVISTQSPYIYPQTANPPAQTKTTNPVPSGAANDAGKSLPSTNPIVRKDDSTSNSRSLKTVIDWLAGFGLLATLGFIVSMLRKVKKEKPKRIDPISETRTIFVSSEPKAAFNINTPSHPIECGEDTEKRTDTKESQPLLRPAAGETRFSKDVLLRMDWRSLEIVASKVFADIEHDRVAISVPNGQGDGGMDVAFYLGDKCIRAIQCKRHTKKVGISVIREVAGSNLDFNAEECFVIGTAGFSEEAKEYARRHKIYLAGADDVINLLSRLPKETVTELETTLLTDDWDTPTCPNCGIKMVSRGNLWKCRRYPRCRAKLQKSSISPESESLPLSMNS